MYIKFTSSCSKAFLTCLVFLLPFMYSFYFFRIGLDDNDSISPLMETSTCKPHVTATENIVGRGISILRI